MTSNLHPAIKICCIASPREAQLAIEAGARAIGLVSAMPSGPGVIDDTLIATIAAMVPPGIDTFLLTALQNAEAIIEQHRRCRTTTIQLVETVEPAELAIISRELPGIRRVQVIHVTSEASIEEALAIAPWVDALLLDSGNPSLAIKQLGGTGRVHDWTLSRRIVERSNLPVWLAGGLNAGNVADAIATVRPFGLDLCNSVRTEDALDQVKLAAFMAAAWNVADDRI